MHPSSLPELYVKSLSDEGEAFVVEVQAIQLPVKGTLAAGIGKLGASRDRNASAGTATAAGSNRPEDVVLDDSQGSDGGLSGSLLKDMPFSRAHSDSSSISSSDLSDSRGHQTSWLRSSMVVRLFFATAITFSEDNNNKKKKNKKKSGSSSSSSLRIFTLQARNDRPRSRHASDNSVEVSVIPGHIVMSDFLRQQLGIRLCSTVQVLEVRDEWKVPLGKQALNLHLSPLTSVVSSPYMYVYVRTCICIFASEACLLTLTYVQSHA